MITAVFLAKALIREAEGFSGIEYKCPAGYPTMGYGRNLTFYPLNAQERLRMIRNAAGHYVVDKLQAENWLEDTVMDIYDSVIGELYFKYLSDARKAVVLDMIYNLGPSSFNSFKKFKRALMDGDFERAALELEDSKYWSQVKTRARRNQKIIKTGEISDELCSK